MNFLITGGCGFIGTNLIKYIFSNGSHSVRVIDDLSVGKIADLGLVCDFKSVPSETITSFGKEPTTTVELVEGSILDETLAVKVSQGADVIIHFAGNTGVLPSVKNPRKDCVANVIGTLNYLEAARLNDVKRFVFASSGGTVIGDCEPPIHEELVPHPKSPYGASKSAAEGYCSAYNGTFGIESVALRFSNVYGPGSNHKNSVVAKFIRRALAGEPLEVYGDGAQTRDFIFVDDLVRAVYLAATVPDIGGEVFQVATNCETTVNEILRLTEKTLTELGVTEIFSQTADPLSGEVRRNFADVKKAKQILGWEPNVVLEDGLKRTVSWFMQQR